MILVSYNEVFCLSGVGNYKETKFGCILVLGQNENFYKARSLCLQQAGDILTLEDNDLSMFDALNGIFGK